MSIQWKVRPPSPDDQLIKYAVEKPTKRQQLSKNIIILIISFVYVFGEYHLALFYIWPGTIIISWKLKYGFWNDHNESNCRNGMCARADELARVCPAWWCDVGDHQSLLVTSWPWTYLIERLEMTKPSTFYANCRVSLLEVFLRG